MRRAFVKKNSAGIALLITLIVLILLSSVIVRFQSDTSLQLRVGRYRVSLLRCRYGAESGIVLGQMMVANAMGEARRFFMETKKDPNAGDALDFKGWSKYFDPNATWQQNLESGTVIAQSYETQVGGVAVKVEIHDENAKLPLLWAMSSPYERMGGQNMVDQPFYTYGNLLGVASDQVRGTIDLARRLAAQVHLPPTEVVLQKNSERRTVSRHQGLRKEMEETKKRRLAMGVFAEIWKSQLQHNLENAALNEPLGEGVGSFADQVGVWGSNHININTAPKEVLMAAFEPLGLTEAMAGAIVETRAQKPFNDISELKKVSGLPEEVYSYMRELCVSYSTSYSIYVTARVGRVEQRLICGIYRSRSGELLNVGIVSGESY